MYVNMAMIMTQCVSHLPGVCLEGFQYTPDYDCVLFCLAILVIAY